MIMWIFILVIALAAFGGCALYLASRVFSFPFIRRMAGEKKWKIWLIGLALVAGLCCLLTWLLNVINMIICMLHLAVFWLLFDINDRLRRKIRKRKVRYRAGYLTILFTIAYLAVAWHIDHHVVMTQYDLTTQKEVGNGMKLVMLADSHMGTTFGGEEFAQYLEEIETLSPDVLLICGDFVDDDTTKEDMIRSCQALGETQTAYGVYYVFGNHDKGYYQSRDFDAEDLVAELEKNGVTVLEDEAVLIDDRFYLIGRQDKSEESRADMQALTDGLDQTKYMIVLDHQPADYEAQEMCGVDLVLSGHTHGGQLFPFNRMGQWTGVDDKSYGYEKRSGTDFIVTSGISDWAIKFKTGCISEYVVIDISQAAAN